MRKLVREAQRARASGAERHGEGGNPFEPPGLSGLPRPPGARSSGSQSRVACPRRPGGFPGAAARCEAPQQATGQPKLACHSGPRAPDRLSTLPSTLPLNYSARATVTEHSGGNMAERSFSVIRGKARLGNALLSRTVRSSPNDIVELALWRNR